MRELTPHCPRYSRHSDAGMPWARVRHPDPAVRVHAVTGLRALDAVTRDRPAPLIDDPSPAVVRAATRALLPDAAAYARPTG